MHMVAYGSNKGPVKSKNAKNKKDNTSIIYVVFLVLLALLLAWVGWMVYDAQRSARPTETAALQTPLSAPNEEASTATTNSGGGSTTTTTTTTGTNGAAGANGAPGAPGGAGQNGTGVGDAVNNVDLGTLSLGLQNGDSKVDVSSKLGQQPNSCVTTSNLPVVGLTELCTYKGSDGDEVQVLYLNNSAIDILRIGS